MHKTLVKKLIRPYMARLISFSLTLWFLIIPISCSLRECRRRQPWQFEEGGVAALYVFGDSFLDTGNNDYINTSTLYRANFWPYGETFFRFPAGRFSDGRLMSDFTAEYAKLPLTRPFLQPGIEKDYNFIYKNGVNFASSGAGALVGTFQGSTKEAARREKHSLFYTWTAEKRSTKEEAGNLDFLNLGPLGCLPGLRILEPEINGGCLEEASTLAKLHNEALSKMLSELENQLKDFRYALYDFHTNLKERMDHPSKYGFKEGITSCCGTGEFRGVFSCGGKRPVKEFELCDNPSEYVFWDSIHLTEEAYKQMAEQMWAGGHSAVKPYNLKNLFQCLY
ncbi:hypothetical protein Vadar_033153 [Vaccinium darrowii]|uniref:Uncharacterized protein n=1 Tax=Vaccinium darrowii TaxID=229202 RepID=A0ACB7ZQL0_9ERIC|nr:hypothetical protein Vadar_033153 [Vaccinium darrowii]